MHPNSSMVLSCHNLSKNYIEGTLRTHVLQHIHLEVANNERLAIIGASGSGKSTLLHLLGGLDAPTDGKVHWGGTDISRLDEVQLSHLRNKYLGFVYQFHHLLPEFTVLENVCLPLLIRGGDIKDIQEQAVALLEKVGLQKRLQHKLGEISGGERQRTAIARALVTKPLCILADEPTGNLDHYTAQQVFETMLELNQEFGTSLVIVTHDQQLAQRMDRILTLQDGVLVS
jgi:lipoprotein-releasing system ATP-binding protein